MNNNLNIAHLIEKNSITRLTKDYENKFLIKIKENFNDNQQQLFVASFYCFLNYDKKNDFVIDFDNVWKWLGFTRKDNSKRLLEKFFIIEIDYKIIFRRTEENKIKVETRGRKEENIMLNVNTFKKFCLKADTKKADEVHDYYVRLEELLQETLNEESNELRKQLMYKEEEKNKLNDNFIELSEIHFKLQENHKRILYKNTRHKLKKGPCLYLIRNPDIDETKKMTKIGTTKNVNIRRSTYITYFEPEFLYIIFTNSNKLLEDNLKIKFIENITNSSEEWIIGIDVEEIISFIEMQASLLNIKFTSHRNISEIEEQDDNEEEEIIEEKNEDDEKNKEDIKECTKCLIERIKIEGFNKDKSKKDGFHSLCKICEKENKLKYTLKKKEEFVELKEKKCNICNELKDVVNFSKHLYNKDGYVNNCLECSQNILNKARQENKDKNVRYKCGTCDKDYARKDTLQKHINNCN